MLEEGRTCLREAHAACGPLQQLGTHVALEFRDLLAHGRAGLAEGPRRGGEAPDLHHPREERHLGHRLHETIVYYDFTKCRPDHGL